MNRSVWKQVFEETWTIGGDTVTVFDHCAQPASVTVLVHIYTDAHTHIETN